jgi:hypothetical protein
MRVLRLVVLAPALHAPAALAQEARDDLGARDVGEEVVHHHPLEVPAGEALGVDEAAPLVDEAVVEAQERDVRPVISNLAERNLLRGKRLGLPSGQAVARAMGATPLTDAELGLSGPFAGAAPLWYYVLAEARHQHGGTRLGDVGGRIVAETILGILDSDRRSYFHVRGFRPMAPAGERFRMGDLLAFAAGA